MGVMEVNGGFENRKWVRELESGSEWGIVRVCGGGYSFDFRA